MTLTNIVVFISDDHGMLDSQPYGATDIRTPHMSRLAADGVRFTHAFTASPSCGPSRTAMLTGLWPARNGAEANHTARRPEVPGLPAALRALGYEVASIGKVAHNSWAKSYDFDVITGPTRGNTDKNDAEKFFSSRDSAKPLCLFFGTHYPHTPWVENNGYDPNEISLPPTFVDTAKTRQERAKYYSSITAADTLLGELRELSKQYLSGDTIFIYTADHGGPWPFGKWDLYDTSTRIPMIISWPNHIPSTTTNNAIVCLQDLLPTFIELGGGTVPKDLDGKSFAGILRGTTTTHRERVFTTHSGDGDYNVYPCRSLRTSDEWAYIRNLHPEFQHHTHISRSAGPSGIEYWESWLEEAAKNPLAAAVVKRYIERPAEELYDLKADPFQLNNLAANPEQATRLTTMRNDVTEWMKSQGDKGTVFGKPLLIGEPVNLIVKPEKKNDKAK